MIDYRVLHTMAELEAVVDLQIKVWGMKARDCVPAALMHVFSANRGLVMGAFDADRMVGLLVALPANPAQEWILWSHMTGVDPDYQNRGIGVALKMRQRAWALENGYTTIRWTADPLQRGNAHFNLGLLGREACLYIDTYHEHFYGDMDDAINRGLPSDRIETVWRIDRDSLHGPIPPTITRLLTTGADNGPVVSEDCGQWNESYYRVDIPRDLDRLRQTAHPTLLAWRMALRGVLQQAFRHGYVAVNFVYDDSGCAYILKRMGVSE